MPSFNTRVLQFGKEVTWGTPIAATGRMMGITDARLRIQDTTEVIPELGIWGPSAVAMQLEQHGEGSLDANSTYEDVLYPLVAMFGNVTPVAGTWTFAAPYANVPVPQLFTAEYGMPGAAYALAGMLVTNLTLAGTTGELERLTAEWIGKKVAPITLASTAVRAVTAVRMADTKVSIDPWAGVMGTTEVPATVVEYELAVNAGRHLKSFLGDISPSDHGEDKWDGTLRLVLEYNAGTKAIVDALLAGTGPVQRLIEITSTSGAKVLKRQFAGTLMAGPVELFSDRDGNAIVETNWAGTYNTVFGNWLKLVVTNAVAVLP